MPYFIYFCIILPLLCYCYRNKPRKEFIPFYVVALLSAIRFDTTSDYHNYVRMFREYSEGYFTDKALIEIGYTYFNRLFGFTEWGFVFVFAISSIFVYYSFYPFFKKYEIASIGTFVLLAMGYITNFDNIIRQSISIALFNYSLYFVQEHKFKYAIAACLIAPLFHTSAYALLPIWGFIFFFNKITINHKIAFFSIVFLFGLYFGGVLDIVRDQLFATSFMMDSIYNHYDEYDFTKRTIGIAFILKTVVCILPLLIKNEDINSNMKLCINMSFISMVIRIIFAEVPFFYRIADYLSIFNIIAISYSIKYFLASLEFKKYAYCIVFFLLLLNYQQVSTYYGYTSQYRTVFSENCKNHYYYVRKTFLDVQNMGIDNERKDYYKLY